MFSFCSFKPKRKRAEYKTDKRNTLTPKSIENINHDILESDKGGDLLGGGQARCNLCDFILGKVNSLDIPVVCILSQTLMPFHYLCGYVWRKCIMWIRILAKEVPV